MPTIISEKIGFQFILFKEIEILEIMYDGNYWNINKSLY